MLFANALLLLSGRERYKLQFISASVYLPIDEFSSNTALEEARTSIAGEDAVVLATANNNSDSKSNNKGKKEWKKGEERRRKKPLLA